MTIDVAIRRHNAMKLSTTKDIGSLVRQTRRDKGLTQIQLAQEVGVGRDWIIRLEQGRSTIELGLVLRTLKALGLNLEVGTKKTEVSDGDTNFIEGIFNRVGGSR